MLSYSEVISKSKAYEIICQDAKRSRLSHAYMFLDSDQNYLVSFAETVCGLLLDGDMPEFSEKNKLRISKRVHPDVKFFGEDKVIDTQTVSDIVESAQVAPFEANIKIFVLVNVNQMNETAQNKILKTIEEPPRNTFFLMLCQSKERMLPTIMSRVKQVELDSISAAEISKMLISVGVSPKVSDIYASCSDSNASFAERLATDENFLTLFGKVVEAFLKINGSRDVLFYSSYFSNKNIDKNEFVQIALMLCRDLQMVKVGKTELVSLKSEVEKLKLIAASLSLEGTNILTEECFAAKKKLFFNVNSAAVSDGLLFKIAEVKVKCKK